MMRTSIEDYYIDHQVKVTIITGDLDALSDDDSLLLSELEQVRAKDIIHDIRKRRFIATRSFLRKSIGHMINTISYTGDFIIDKYGKPFLPPPYSSLNFNMSHTNNEIVVAFSWECEVGIDIESSNRAIPPFLMEYTFDEKEMKYILSSRDWRTTFIQGWTYKEAILKCLGCGFLCDPKKIPVFWDNATQQHSKLWKLSFREVVYEMYHLIPFVHPLRSIGAVALRKKD